ncbi:MAG: ArsR/SmtB family transcription factor [bacterium]
MFVEAEGAGREEAHHVHLVDVGKVRSIRRAMKSNRTFSILSDTFKALGDPARSKIIFALSRAELCVCDLSSLLGLSESAVSHHLRVLRNMRLVKHRRAGRMVYYSLDDDHIVRILDELLEHVEE